MKKTLTFAFMGLFFGAATTQAAMEITEQLHVGGEVRARNESHLDYDLNGDVGEDDNVTGLRSSITFMLMPTEDVDIVLEARDYRFYGQNGNAPAQFGEDGDLGLYQGYFNARFMEDRLQFKIGRQELELGSGRLFSDFDWYEGLAHDIALASWMEEQYQVHLFTAKFNEASIAPLNQGGIDENDNYLFGTHFTYMDSENSRLDAYFNVVKLNNYFGILPLPDAEPTFYTIGVSYENDNLDMIFFDAEGIYQTGSVGVDGGNDVDIAALAGSANVGVKFDDGNQRVWLSLNYASGNDDDAEEIEEFFDLFGNTYGELGYMNRVARRNLGHIALRYRGEFQDDKLAFEAAIHYFALADEGGVDQATGTVIGGQYYTIDPFAGYAGLPGQATGQGNGEDTALGTEFDLRIEYNFDESLSFAGGVSIFAPGDYDAFGANDEADNATLVYLQGKAKI